MVELKLSIVSGTLNRKSLLIAMLESVRESCGDMPMEIIIVDGGSTDGTLDYLREQADVTLIAQGQRLGAVCAFNAGFNAAHGQYVANLNDDCIVIGDTLQQAVKYLDNHPKVGQVAIPFGTAGEIPKTQIIPNWLAKMWNKRDLPYANFGVTRKEIGDKVGWWGDRLYHYGGDVRLSIETWLAGYSVAPLDSGSIVHYAVDDTTRVPNVETQMLMQIYHPQRAWEFETQESRRRARQGTHQTEQREREHQVQRMQRTARNGKIRFKPIHSYPAMVNPTTLRYIGKHTSWALYADCPSGHQYRVRLAYHLQFYVDANDAAWFVSKREDNAPCFEVVK